MTRLTLPKRMIIVQRFGLTLLRIGISKEEYDNTILRNLSVRVTKITSLPLIKEFIERQEQRGEN